MIKELVWLGSSLNDLRSFSETARRESGHVLHVVQLGGEPPDAKPMPGIGKGVKEIRIHTEREYRVFYITKFEEAVYVLHAFPKKSQKTLKRDLDLARKRLNELLAMRRRRR